MDNFEVFHSIYFSGSHWQHNTANLHARVFTVCITNHPTETRISLHKSCLDNFEVSRSIYFSDSHRQHNTANLRVINLPREGIFTVRIIKYVFCTLENELIKVFFLNSYNARVNRICSIWFHNSHNNGVGWFHKIFSNWLKATAWFRNYIFTR